MSKSWVLMEIEDKGGEKTMRPLAGTEDHKCVNRALNAMKLYKDEVAKIDGKVDLTLIHSTVVDDPDYNPTLDDVLNPEPEDQVENILSLVKMD